MKSFKEEYELWREKADGEVAAELENIKDDEAEDRFYRELSFGTGGLRGKIGAGTNRLNIYTVARATKGLAAYINASKLPKSAAIAFDSRKNSELFARTAAAVLAEKGIKAHIFRELMPTPMLSFAVRGLKCGAGIVITASHNPKEYNGYKVYGADGCQITNEAADAISRYIAAEDYFSGLPDPAAAFAADGISYIDKGVIDKYFEKTLEKSVYNTKNADLKIVYSPLCGTGNKPVRRILNSIGMSHVIVVPRQEKPDAEFITCPFPNPEEKEAMSLAVALADETGADIALATDPDCDRVGAAVMDNGSFKLLNGNQMGVLLLDFVCRMRIKNGSMPERPLAVKTIVTTNMARAVAQKYGVELCEVLTGFKYIGELIGKLESRGEAERFIFGFEESYGYLSGSCVRDKDGVDAAMLICEMAQYYKTIGKTLCEALRELYAEYGFYFEKLESVKFEGASGMEKMKKIMLALRNAPPKKLGDMCVTGVRDYIDGAVSNGIALPPSDVIAFDMEGGSWAVVRPSGTEPKLKIYYSIKCEDEKSGAIAAEAAGKTLFALIG